MKNSYQFIIQQLTKNRISLAKIAQLAINYQGLYSQVPSLKVAENLLKEIIKRPSVAENLLVCLTLEKQSLSEPLNTIYQNEDLTQPLLLQIAATFGTIGISNYFEIKLNHPELLKLSANPKMNEIGLALEAALSGEFAQMDS